MTGSGLGLLIDTQVILWIAAEPFRLTETARAALLHDAIFVSAVTAYEYADLNRRGRFGADYPLSPILDQLGAVVLDYPAQAWVAAQRLPDLHRDPVDRMLVAHAIHADLTLVTADATMRDYPVRCLW